MPQVYQAANTFEAQLVLDELRAGGLDAYITGAYLSGAIGELPPDSLIRVWIREPQHRLRARAIIEEFEAARRETGPDRPCADCGELLAPQFGRCWQCGAWMHHQ